MKKKCYIYTRVSTAAQTEGYSLEAQQERLRQYAEYKNLEIAGEYCDAGKSGKSILGRPAFMEMMDDIASGKGQISYVLVFKLSRFGRNAADVLKSIQTLLDYDVDLVCVEDSIDSSTQGGRLTLAILSAVAEIERENIRVQFMAGRLQKMLEGGWAGGPAPFGYRNKNGKLTVEPGEAEIVRLIYAKYLESDMKLPSVVNALEEGTDSEGGYLVPDEYERTLVEALEEENVFRQLAKVIRTSSGDRKIPVVAAKGTAAWIDEEGAYTESDDSFGQVSIGAYKVGTMIKVSEELLNDSVFDLESYIAKEFARRIGAKEEEAFFTGDGSGKPLGVLAATGGAETGVTAASSTAITADELMDLFYSLKSPYRKKAVWVLNDSTIKAVRKLKDSTGQYLWQPSLVAGTPDTLLGRPVKTSAYMPVIAAGAKTIAFGDFSYYWIADRQRRSFKRLNELYAANGQVGFLGSQRVDGKLVLSEAVKVLAQKAGSTG